MLKVTKIRDNRLDVDIGGKIDAEQMQQVMDELIPMIEEIDHGKFLYRIGELQIPTLGAIGVELQYVPKLFRLLRHIDRIAVVCDQDWIQNWANIEGKLIPGLEMKSFDLEEEDEAEAWLA